MKKLIVCLFLVFASLINVSCDSSVNISQVEEISAKVVFVRGAYVSQYNYEPGSYYLILKNGELNREIYLGSAERFCPASSDTWLGVLHFKGNIDEGVIVVSDLVFGGGHGFSPNVSTDIHAFKYNKKNELESDTLFRHDIQKGTGECNRGLSEIVHLNYMADDDLFVVVIKEEERENCTDEMIDSVSINVYKYRSIGEFFLDNSEENTYCDKVKADENEIKGSLKISSAPVKTGENNIMLTSNEFNDLINGRIYSQKEGDLLIVTFVSSIEESRMFKLRIR